MSAASFLEGYDKGSLSAARAARKSADVIEAMGGDVSGPEALRLLASALEREVARAGTRDAEAAQ